MKKIMRGRERGKKKSLRLLSVMLCFCLLITACPCMPGTVVVHAAGGQENGRDSVIQALFERIAALPDAEGYLAKEPDTEEEEVYAEWMEGLHQCAGEALDIQEAYEALTEEQQVQIPAEAFTKLAAWVEIAEQIAGNSMVMAAAASGTCGDNVTWTLDDTGTLTISGTGAMADYNMYSNRAPWYDYGTNITSIKIQGVTYIGTYAFYDLGDFTDGISSVEISGSVTEIGESAFIYSKITDIVIPDSVTSIGAQAFCACTKLTSVALPKNLSTIEPNTFDSCYALTEVTIPESVTSIGAYAFKSTVITQVTIPGEVTIIANSAFADTKLTSVDIPGKVTVIDEYAFGSCKSLESVSIPNSVKTIGKQAFKGCTSLTEMDIPSSVTSIGKEAFKGCSVLATVNFTQSTPPTLVENCFIDSACLTNKGIMIPCSWEDSALTADNGWETYKTNVTKVHNYNYTASGKAITQTCPNGCGHSAKATLTLSNTSLVYTGQPRTPASVTYTGDTWVGTEPTIGYENNTNVGTATAKMTVTGQTASVSREFAITAATLKGVTANDYTGVYDGTAHGITVTAPAGATVKYGTSQGTYTLTSSPTYTDVGTYTVYYQVTKDNYKTVTGSVAVKITAATLTGVTANSYTGVYDGTAHGITVTAPADATVKYGTSQGTYTLTSSPTYTNVGTYTVYYQVTKSNYETVTGSATVKITAADISSATVTLSSTTLTYNGSEQTKEVSSVTIGNTPLTEGTDYTISGNKGTDAGDYTITITGIGGYAGSTKTVTFRIEPKPLTADMITLASDSYSYTGSAITPAVTVHDGDRNMDLTEVTDYTVSYADNVSVGTGAKVTVTGTGNYSGSIDKTFTIAYSPLPSGKSLADYVTISPEPTNGWYGSDITLTPKSGCEVGETSAGMGTSAVTIMQETGTGGDKKTIYIKDSTGNIYQTEFTYKLDKTPPVVDLADMTVENGTKNLWDWIIGKKSMMIKIPVAGITETLSGVAEVSYTAESDNGTTQTGTIHAQDGYYEIALNAEFGGTIQLTVKDKAGHTTQASLTAASGKVIAEDHAPVVTFTLPDTSNADGWYHSDVEMKVTVTDDKDSNSGSVLSGGIAEIRWKDGANGTVQTVAGLPGNAPVYGKDFTISVNTDGIHIYYVNAVDNAGNESGWQKVTVKVDTGKPEFNGAITVKNLTEEGADIVFTPSEGGKVYWTLSDTGTAPSAQEVKEQSGLKGGVQDITGDTENSFTITGLSAGEEHTVYVVLEDAAGNLSEIKTESFLTLQKAPEITLEQLIIDYTKETIKLPDNFRDVVEVYTDPELPENSKITPNADGSLPVAPGTAVYIRYPEKTEDGMTVPASDKTKIQIPDRPVVPAKQITVSDNAITVTNPDSMEEYVLVKKGETPDWEDINVTGKFTGLDVDTEYDLYVRIKATENSFVSEPTKTEIRTKDHAMQKMEAKEPGCTEAGNKEYFICSECNKLFADAQGTIETDSSKVTIPATGHTFPEQWMVEKEATEKEPGRQYKVCETCGTKIYQTIDPAGMPSDPYAGKIEKEVEVQPGAPDTVLNNSKEELAESVLTPEEMTEIDNSANAKIWLEIAPDVDITETEKAQVQKVAEESVGAGAEVTYFDASLYKQVGNGEKTIIHEPKKPVSVTIVIPENIRNKDVLMVRNYQIIRLHEGKINMIEGAYKEDSAEFTFETDKFSTFALAYRDVLKNPTAVTLDKGKVTLTKAGETAQLTAGIVPADAANKKVTWSSSNPKVAKVDADGKVTAVGNGTCTITAATEDGTKTAVCKVTVNMSGVETPGITDKPSKPEQPGTTENPGNTTSPDVPKKEQEKNALSLNAKLKVSQTGKKITIAWGKVAGADGYDVYVQYCGKKFTKKSITAVKSGKTTKVTVKKVNGKALNLKKNYKIYVRAYKLADGRKITLGKTITAHIVGKNNTKYTNVKAVKVKKSSYTLKKGKTAQIKARTVLVSPGKKQLTNAHAKQFRYATTNKKVATVSAKGKMKAVGKGTCTIYVYARNGYAKKVKVKVK